MIPKIAAMVERLECAQNQAAQYLRELEAARKSCHHDWSKPVWSGERNEGYTIPADGAGSDWRPPCHVPAETIDRWKRICNICGETEETNKQKEIKRYEPQF